jgi:hypothetical protein
MKPLLIGLSGKAGSGKSTAADYLFNQHGYIPFAFADPLKGCIRIAFGFSVEQLHGNLKEIIDLRFGKSPRWCLQHLGSAFREAWPEIWIYHLRLRIMDFLSEHGQTPLMITDVRFRDEAEALKRMGAVLVRIERDESLRTTGGDACATKACATGVPGHVSERDLDDWEGFDFLIVNNGTQEQLLEQLALMIDSTRS